MIINGQEYSWGDLSLLMGGRDVCRMTAIDYKTEQSKEPLYGKGNKPIAIQSGNVKHSGTVTILQSELNTLQELARMNFGRPDILKLNLNAVVCYGNPLQGDVMTVDRLFGIQFTEIPKGMKQGDSNMEIALPFVCTDIKYNS